MDNITQIETQLESKSDATDLQDMEQFVPRKAYKEVTSDMMKYKNALKETQAELNEFKIRQQRIEEEKLVEQSKFKELFELKDKELNEFKKQVDTNKDSLIKQQKLNAVLGELGQLERPEFSQFIPLDKVEIQESGAVDSESVRRVAEQFKQEFGMCLKRNVGPNLPGNAPTTAPPTTKHLGQMNLEELKQLYTKVKKK